jgi:hypothetical protein
MKIWQKVNSATSRTMGGTTVAAVLKGFVRIHAKSSH